MTENSRSSLWRLKLHSRPAEGSLWQENGTMGELFVNPKARRVGDIVTIKIVESSKASNNASTNTGRDSSVSLGIDKFLGLENNVTPDAGFKSVVQNCRRRDHQIHRRGRNEPQRRLECIYHHKGDRGIADREPGHFRIQGSHCQ